MISRKLYKNGNLHGVQRTWHKNGQLASEEPYFEGKRDGLFRHWDEQGHLIGQYQFTNGVGVVKVYNSQGILIREEQYPGDKSQRALRLDRDPDGAITLREEKGGVLDGPLFYFRADDSIHFMICSIARPDKAVFTAHGPIMELDERGNPLTKEWYVFNKQVSEVQYAKAAATDRTLPPYFADAKRYKELVTPEVKALLETYRKAPPVKIPLELDARADPKLAAPK